MSAPDLPLPGVKKKPSGDAAAAIIEEDDAEGGDGDGDGEAGVDASVTTQRRDEENHPPPPPPPPTRSPPRLPPETEPKVPQGTSWDEFIFGSQDTMPPLTLEPDAPEPSWAAEKREAAAQPQPQPQPTPVEEVAETKKVEDASDIQKVEEAGERRAATQKAARKAEGKKGRLVVVAPAATNLLKILHQLDDHFLKASQSAHEVSKILEAARLHYHSNFAETRGFVDHSARVMQVITWNRSFKGIPQPENVKNELYDDEWETHATVLDKLLAWEKKLYHEVKDFEVIKLEYQQKLAVLNRKKQRGASSASLEKTKSVVSHLHTKYVVDVQTMESTVAEINQLRDEQLYPKLFELVRGMEKMWDAMHIHHREQLRIISELKSFDISVAIRETSEQHHERTMQLLDIVRKWHSLFNNFMMSQKEYIENLYHWLKLNVIPIETNLKGKPNSSQPPHETMPPIKRLLHTWHDKLGKLPHEAAKNAIFRFSEVVRTIVLHQEDELKLRVKCEEMRRDLERKKRQFEDWAQKYMKKRAGILPEDNNANGDPLVERRAAVESLNHALKEEEENCRVKCRVVREKSINILRTSLPELFRAVSDFSGQSAAMFRSLRSIAHSNDQLEE